MKRDSCQEQLWPFQPTALICQRGVDCVPGSGVLTFFDRVGLVQLAGLSKLTFVPFFLHNSVKIQNFTKSVAMLLFGEFVKVKDSVLQLCIHFFHLTAFMLI